MESSYILILLVFLIILLVGIVFFGYRQLTQMSMLVNQHSSAIDALRNFLNRMLEPPPQEQYDEYERLVQQQRELQPTNESVADETLEEPADDEEFSDMNIEEHIEKEIQTSSDVKKDDVKKVEEFPKIEEVKEVKKVEEPFSEVSAISETPKEDIKEISIHPQTIPAPVITDEKKDGDVVEDVKIIEVKGKDGKIKQKFPTESPKDLPIGTVRMFENKEYVVFETVTGIRRWKLQGK